MPAITMTMPRGCANRRLRASGSLPTPRRCPLREASRGVSERATPIAQAEFDQLREVFLFELQVFTQGTI